MQKKFKIVKTLDKRVRQIKSNIISNLHFHSQFIISHFIMLLLNLNMPCSRALFSLFILCVLVGAQQSNQTSSAQPKNAHDQLKHEFEYWILESTCVQIYYQYGMKDLPLRCYAYSLSQIFNIILIPICLFLRVPQILVIVRNKSVYGLSFFGNNLELLMTSMTLAYGLHANFSFWIYGQNIILSIQNMIIISLFFQYPPPGSPQSTKTYLKSLLLPIFFTFFISSLFVLQLVPSWCQQASIWLQLLVFIGARGSQIINNFKFKTVQNVSLKTYAITLFANFARTFTILIESPQSLGYLLNYLIPIFINGTLVLQIMTYRKQLKSQ